MNVTMKKIIVQILLLAAIKFQVATTSRRNAKIKLTTEMYQNDYRRYTEDDSYEVNRTKLIARELNDSIGGNISNQTADEKKVNNILMKLKINEANKWIKTPIEDDLYKHYSSYMDLINTSKLFKIIKKMPKGGALHVNNKFAMDANYMVELMKDINLYVHLKNTKYEKHETYDRHEAYEETRYPIFEIDDNIYSGNTLQFGKPDEDEWYPMHYFIKEGSAHYSKENVDKLRKAFTFITEATKAVHICRGSLNALWDKFEKISSLITKLINYRPIRERFIYDTLKKFYDDNIMYAEIRVSVQSLHQLHELNGTKHEPSYLIKLYEETTKRFIEEYPDFIGIKLIVSKNLAVNEKEIEEAISFAESIKKNFPDIFAGFDMIGGGKKGKRLSYVHTLFPNDMNLYFHAGETSWHGTASKESVTDAFLLGSKRIGQGNEYDVDAFFRKCVKKRDIAIEVNALPNVVLDITTMRNHPLRIFLAYELPVVLSTDDPGLWGAEPLSHNFYTTFVTLAKSYDLKLLKKLAMNSIKYSALENIERNKLYTVFNKRWDLFIKEVIKEYYDAEDYDDSPAPDSIGCYDA